ncbi:SDR family NAD(P)-dependent oxidoreductase [Humibacter albus]|uniref:SDR family NAD(P)-dependent oxidoreductase n=1 Tax=Humibacter albus TaxID=427754 RepID=UPI0003B4630D|nr:SDR family NAD(P)-dependent oxidoreductase [Humibacter albus]
MDSMVSGRTALVTGGGRGIGAAIAEQLAIAGAATVIIVARSATELERTAARVRASGAAATTLAIDLAKPSGVDKVTAALETDASIDILVSAAATVAPLGPTASLDAREVRRALELNVIAPILLAGAFVGGMAARGFGRVVNVSSGIAEHPGSMVGGTVYATSKSGLEAHTLNLAVELHGTGVTANVYRPGTVDTAMQEWIRAQDPDRIGRGLHDRFTGMHDSGRLITATRSAEGLMTHLLHDGDASGQIWDVADDLSAP